MRARLVAVVLLVIVGVVAVLAERPPDSVAATAPPTDFSAERAMTVVGDLAREPRPIGSPASNRVRDALIARLAAEGLNPRVDASAVLAGDEGQAVAARVDNVVATLPGRDPTGAIVLMAHDDSVSAGPGASDDMSGVATILETVRALRAGPALRNDVTVVITDGEEAGLLGARAWVREQLPRDRPTVVLNWEARGVSGPSLLFETSPGNAGLIQTWADAVPHPRGDSSLVEVYRFLPNDTDLSPVLDAGRPGMNAAFIEGADRYHTPDDTPANLDPASVQNHGANALALTRALGERDLAPLDPAASGAPPQGDLTYFRALGLLVTYPDGWALPVSLLAVLTVLALVVLARRRSRATVAGVLGGAGGYLVALAVAVGLGLALWQVLVAIRPSYGDIGPFLGRPLAYEIADALLALLAVTATVAVLRRRPGPVALASGALLVIGALAVLLAVVAPGSAFLLAWPVIGLALGLVVVVLAGDRPVVAAVGLVVGAVPAVALLVPFAVASFGVAGVSDGLPVVVLVLLGVPVAAGLSALPRPRAARGFAVPLVALGWVVVLVCVGLVVDRPDARSPQGSHLAYVLDADTGRAQWVTTDQAPAAWTAGYAGSAPAMLESWPGDEPVGTGPAPALAVPAPAVTVLGRTPDSVRLQISSPRGAPTISLRTDRPTRSVAVSFPGRAVVTSPLSGSFQLRIDDVPPEGAVVDLQLGGPGPVVMRVDDQSLGLAAVPGFAPRPPDLRQARGNDSDQVVVSRRVTA